MDYPKTKDEDKENDNDNDKTKTSDEKYRKLYSYCIMDKTCSSFRITTDDFDFNSFQRQFPLICPSVSQDGDEMDSDRKKYPNIIIPNQLYLGDMWNRNSIKCLKDLGITHIVDATKDNFEKDKFKILKIALPDLPSAKIDEHFESAIEFVDEALSNKDNQVLIHCQMGISRSTTLTIAYLMKSKGYTLYDAYKLCKDNRPRIRPNDGFYQRLTQFEMTVFDGKSTKDKIDEEKLRDVSSTDCVIM